MNKSERETALLAGCLNRFRQQVRLLPRLTSRLSEEELRDQYDINDYEIEVDKSAERSLELPLDIRNEPNQENLVLQYLVYLEQKNTELKSHLQRLDEDKSTMYRRYEERKKVIMPLKLLATQ